MYYDEPARRSTVVSWETGHQTKESRGGGETYLHAQRLSDYYRTPCVVPKEFRVTEKGEERNLSKICGTQRAQPSAETHLGRWWLPHEGV